MKYIIVLMLFLWFHPKLYNCDLQSGPDPWHYEEIKLPAIKDETHLPFDLRTPLKKDIQTETKFGFGEWWFKRLLALILKSGQVTQSEDDSNILVSIQMKFDENQWRQFHSYLKSESALSDDMFRQFMGHIENSIFKPTITDKIVMAWSEYIQVYLTEYKMYITAVLGALSAIGILAWLWKYSSLRHIIIGIFISLYIYEVVISYMEAEQIEYEKFISAINTCKWYFWTSECAVPSPDLILFLKHMNPMKIAIRMFTSLISEPVLAISSTVKIMLQDITGGLWFPFDKIVYGLLIVAINISLLYLLVMIIFHFIFNISFNLNFLGIIGINVRQNRRSFIPSTTSESSTPPPAQLTDTDRISGDRLDRILNVCSLALSQVHSRPINDASNFKSINSSNKLQRSASTGRLPSLCSSENNITSPVSFNLKRRSPHNKGEGDH